MKKLQIALISIFLFAALLMLALQSDWGKELAQKTLLKALSESGYSVEIGKIEGTLPHAIDFKDVKINSDTLSMSIDSLETRLSLLALLKKEILFTDIKANGISWKEKPGTVPSLGKGKGLSFAIRVKRFQLTDVSLQENIHANLEGALRIGKKNRDFYLDITASRPEFPASSAHAVVYFDEGGSIRIKGSFQSPTLRVLPLSLPFDASADLRFAFRGRKDFIGHISGTIIPHSVSIEPLAPWVEKEWRVATSVSNKGQGWELSRLVLSATPLKINGNATLAKDGRLEQANLNMRDPKTASKFEIKANNKGGFVIKAEAKRELLKIDSISLENVEARGEFFWNSSHLSGTAAATALMFGKSWKGNTDLSWQEGSPLFLTDLALEGPAASFSGNLEIRPDKIALGEIALNIGNLQDLPLGLYGSVQGKTDWLVSNGKQVMTAELIGSGIYWKDLFAQKASVLASIIDPFQDRHGRLVIEAEEVKWRQMSLDHLNFETLVGASKWPFALAVSGRWKHPLALNLGGIWHYDNSHFTSTLQTVSGSFYNHGIALEKEVEIEYAPDLFRVGGLNLKLSGATAYLFIEDRQNNLDAELILKKFPLDVLSLNPLDVSIAGQTDCTLLVSEKNGKMDGTLNASIHQMEIASLGEKALLSASGNFEGRFDNDRLALKGGLQMEKTPLLSLDLSLPIRISRAPFHAELLYERAVKGHLTINSRIEEILDFFDLGTHRIEGDIACDFNLTHTLASPKIDGKLHFENGYYENYLTGTRLLDIKADGIANGDRITIDSFAASDGKGILTASGRVDFLPAQDFPFFFDISFNHFPITDIDLVSAEAEGKIEIEGNLKGALAKGRLEVVRSDLHVPDRIPRSLPNLVVVYKNAVKPIPQPELELKEPYPLKLDLEVKAPDGIFIDGRGLNSEWKGDFHIGGTYTSLAAQGKLELIKGEFLFSGRRFKLLDGALSFTGKEREMPYLNLAAQMEVKDISITARLKGPLNNPQLTLQSVPPLPLSTIMSYLLFGQEMAEINSFQALQLANSLASLAGQGPDVLENTRRALGVDRLNIVSVPSSDAEMEDAIAVQVGKYISEGVLVSYSQGAEDSSSNINIEIELKGGWIVQLESDQRQEQGKFTIKWNHNY